MSPADANLRDGRFHESHLRLLLDSLPCSIASIDHREIYQHVNSHYAALVDRPRKEIAGRHVRDILSKDSYANAKPHIDAVLTGQPVSYEARFLFGEKEPCWLSVHLVPDIDSEGRITGFVVMAYDISQRKRAEEALRRSEERYRLTFEKAAVGVTHVALEGSFLRVNQKFCDIVGYSREELVGMTFQEITHPDDLDHDLVLVREMVARERETCSSEKRYIRKDGELVWVSITVSMVWEEDGGSGYFINVVEEIGARKEAEATQRKLEGQLRQAQKMEAIGTLAGGVAHDFNNILQAVMGYTELLGERITDDEDAHCELEEIEKGCERAAMLTRQLLTFSRQQVIRPAHIDIDEVITGVLKMLRRLIGEDIDLVYQSPAPLAAIFADRNQLEQVLMNLAINARDAMPGGGVLTVQAENRELDTEACRSYEEILPGRHVVLSISDTGLGMDGETRTRIFDPFFTTKGPGRGTGLGLSTVYGIVRQHEGHIFVTSEPGQGARFEIFFPAAAAAAERGEAPAVKPAPGGSETILLAEDDEIVVRLAAKVLTGAGYTVLVVRDGRTAVDEFSFRKGEIDLVILDAVMPVLNGKQACDEMRDKVPGLKVLFITGYPVDGMHKRFVLDSDIRVMQKPFLAGDFLRQVRALIDEK